MANTSNVRGIRPRRLVEYVAAPIAVVQPQHARIRRPTSSQLAVPLERPRMAVIKPHPILERRPGPYAANRRCSSCGAVLSRQNADNRCAPCGSSWNTPRAEEMKAA
jgi:hypothetical protein